MGQVCEESDELRRDGGDEANGEKAYDTVELSVNTDCSDLSAKNNH